MTWKFKYCCTKVLEIWNSKQNINKKDGYRQRNVRQFLQSAYKAQFGYLTRVTPVCRCLHPFCGWMQCIWLP